MDPQAYTIIENDEVDLLALRRCLADSRLALRKQVSIRDAGYGEEYENYVQKHAYRQIASTAAMELVRFDGKKFDPKTEITTYAWSFYGLHPETAEQMIRALDFLLDRFGHSFVAPQRAERHSPKTVRNKESKDDNG